MRQLNFLSLFKLHFQAKKPCFKIIFYKSYTQAIELLISLNLIKKIKKRGKVIFIWPNLKPKKNTSFNIKILYNLSFKKNFSITTIKQMRYDNYDKVLILSTNKGLISIQTALKLNVGGFLYLKIV